jgi:hypothetical protein
LGGANEAHQKMVVNRTRQQSKVKHTRQVKLQHHRKSKDEQTQHALQEPPGRATHAQERKPLEDNYVRVRREPQKRENKRQQRNRWVIAWATRNVGTRDERCRNNKRKWGSQKGRKGNVEKGTICIDEEGWSRSRCRGRGAPDMIECVGEQRSRKNCKQRRPST